MELPDDAPKPRLCHLIKWPHFDGYGFNLHAEKSKAGQYIGKVDDDSPAQTAGLKEGDRIIEVNMVNISNENHRQVVERIKSNPNETKLLVVDEEADRWYKERKLIVKSSQPNVIYSKTPVQMTPVQMTTPTTTPSLGSSQISAESTPPPTPPIKTNPPSTPPFKINGNKNDNDQHIDINNHIKNNNDNNNHHNGSSGKEESHFMENGANSRSSTPQSNNTAEIQNNRPSSVGSNAYNSSIPGSPTSSKSGHSSNGPFRSLSDNNVELNLNMTASEMRQILAQKKKHDVKKAQLDLKQKYEIIQQM